MKVLLTSTGLKHSDIRDVFLSNIEKSLRFYKVLFVTCAAIDKESKDMVKECYKELLDLNIKPSSITEYDLEYKMSVDELNKYDLIYVCGEDENYLIEKIVVSKMRSNLINAVKDGLFYIGVSAGTRIASPYVKDGLNFCPNKINVHCIKSVTPNGELPPSSVQINLSDGQAVWIKDNTMTIIGTDTSHSFKLSTDTEPIKNLFDIPSYFESIHEDKLKTSERTCFGLPSKKKYPMPDANHVLQAIRMFNYCSQEDEEELAANINKYIKAYDIRDIHVGEKNRFSKYYHP